MELVDPSVETVEFIGDNPEYFGTVLENSPTPGGAQVSFAPDPDNPLSFRGLVELSLINKVQSKLMVFTLSLNGEELIKTEREMYLKDLEELIKDSMEKMQDQYSKTGDYPDDIEELSPDDSINV